MYFTRPNERQLQQDVDIEYLKILGTLGMSERTPKIQSAGNISHQSINKSLLEDIKDQEAAQMIEGNSQLIDENIDIFADQPLLLIQLGVQKTVDLKKNSEEDQIDILNTLFGTGNISNNESGKQQTPNFQAISEPQGQSKNKQKQQTTNKVQKQSQKNGSQSDMNLLGALLGSAVQKKQHSQKNTVEQKLQGNKKSQGYSYQMTQSKILETDKNEQEAQNQDNPDLFEALLIGVQNQSGVRTTSNQYTGSSKEAVKQKSLSFNDESFVESKIEKDMSDTPEHFQAVNIFSFVKDSLLNNVLSRSKGIKNQTEQHVGWGQTDRTKDKRNESEKPQIVTKISQPFSTTESVIKGKSQSLSGSEALLNFFCSNNAKAQNFRLQSQKSEERSSNFIDQSQILNSPRKISENESNVSHFNAVDLLKLGEMNHFEQESFVIDSTSKRNFQKREEEDQPFIPAGTFKVESQNGKQASFFELILNANNKIQENEQSLSKARNKLKPPSEGSQIQQSFVVGTGLSKFSNTLEIEHFSPADGKESLNQMFSVLQESVLQNSFRKNQNPFDISHFNAVNLQGNNISSINVQQPQGSNSSQFNPDEKSYLKDIFKDSFQGGIQQKTVNFQQEPNRNNRSFSQSEECANSCKLGLQLNRHRITGEKPTDMVKSVMAQITKTENYSNYKVTINGVAVQKDNIDKAIIASGSQSEECKSPFSSLSKQKKIVIEIFPDEKQQDESSQIKPEGIEKVNGIDEQGNLNQPRSSNTPVPPSQFVREVRKQNFEREKAPTRKRSLPNIDSNYQKQVKQKNNEPNSNIQKQQPKIKITHSQFQSLRERKQQNFVPSKAESSKKKGVSKEVKFLVRKIKDLEKKIERLEQDGSGQKNHDTDEQTPSVFKKQPPHKYQGNKPKLTVSVLRSITSSQKKSVRESISPENAKLNLELSQHTVNLKISPITFSHNSLTERNPPGLSQQVYELKQKIIQLEQGLRQSNRTAGFQNNKNGSEIEIKETGSQLIMDSGQQKQSQRKRTLKRQSPKEKGENKVKVNWDRKERDHHLENHKKSKTLIYALEGEESTSNIDSPYPMSQTNEKRSHQTGKIVKRFASSNKTNELNSQKPQTSNSDQHRQGQKSNNKQGKDRVLQESQVSELKEYPTQEFQRSSNANQRVEENIPVTFEPIRSTIPNLATKNSAPVEYKNRLGLEKTPNASDLMLQFNTEHEKFNICDSDPTQQAEPINLGEGVAKNSQREDFQGLQEQLPVLPQLPSNFNPQNSNEELIEIGKQLFPLFGCQILEQDDKAFLKVRKFKNCTYFGIDSNNNILWGFDGKIYFGGWTENQRSSEGQKFGQGIQFMPGKYTFKGQFNFGKKNGFGILKTFNGEKAAIYIGQFVDGFKHGRGKYIEKNGSIYDGQWRAGKKDGQGILQSISNQVYQGTFLENQQSGFGTERFKNGDIYKGEYRRNKFEGKGVYQWASGAKYEGEFVNGKRNGYGIWTSTADENCDIYQGHYKDDKKQGRGKYTWPNGSYYDGEFHDDKKHGIGVTRYENGKQATLLWQYGKVIKRVEQEGDYHMLHSVGEKNMVSSNDSIHKAIKFRRPDRPGADSKTFAGKRQSDLMIDQPQEIKKKSISFNPQRSSHTNINVNKGLQNSKSMKGIRPKSQRQPPKEAAYRGIKTTTNFANI